MKYVTEQKRSATMLCEAYTKFNGSKAAGHLKSAPPLHPIGTSGEADEVMGVTVNRCGEQ